MDSKMELLRSQIQEALDNVTKAYDSKDVGRISRAEKELERAENAFGAYLESKRRLLRESTEERQARIAGKMMARGWPDEISYGLGVALGNVPAYNSYYGSLQWIERGISTLKLKKRVIIEKLGQDIYDKFVKAFDDLKESWRKVGDAEDDVQGKRDNLRFTQSKYVELDKMTWEW